MTKKNTLAIRRNCSKRLTGKKVYQVYREVTTRLPSWRCLASAGAGARHGAAAERASACGACEKDQPPPWDALWPLCIQTHLQRLVGTLCVAMPTRPGRYWTWPWCLVRSLSLELAPCSERHCLLRAGTVQREALLDGLTEFCRSIPRRVLDYKGLCAVCCFAGNN